MDRAGHLWQALGLGWATVVVEFHEPVTLEDFSSRKALADHCYRRISEGVATALAGHPQRFPEPAAVERPREKDAAPGGDLAPEPS